MYFVLERLVSSWAIRLLCSKRYLYARVVTDKKWFILLLQRPHWRKKVNLHDKLYTPWMWCPSAPSAILSSLPLPYLFFSPCPALFSYNKSRPSCTFLQVQACIYPQVYQALKVSLVLLWPLNVDFLPVVSARLKYDQKVNGTRTWKSWWGTSQ